MTIDPIAIAIALPPEQRPARTSARFDEQLAQCVATPLFSPWPATDPSLRSTLAAAGAALNTHPATSNRREGRHARG